MTTRYGSAVYGTWRNKHFGLLERSGQLRDDRRILLNGFEMDSVLEISGMTAIGHMGECFLAERRGTVDASLHTP